jgi:site-specific recombinase XerD
LTTRQVSRIVYRLGEKAGMGEVGVTPHYFRHVFATRALERTENLALVQDMLGHASPATTRVYARTDETQRREGYARVWGDGEVEHSVDAFAESEGTFEAAVSIVQAVRAEGAGRAGEGGEAFLMRAAMIELLWSTGCTVEELVSLRRDDVELESRRVYFVSCSDTRFSYLTDRAAAALDAYLHARGTPPSAALFVDGEGDGSPWTPGRARAMLEEAADEAGLDAESLPPDLFRSAFIARSMEAMRYAER